MATKKKDDSPKKEKEKDKFLTRDQRAAAVIEDVNKKYKGRAVLRPASEFYLPYLSKRIPTGLLTLDLELRGGFPAAGLSQIIGRRNAGKTLLMWLCIRQLQNLIGPGMRVLLAMTELAADRSQARKAGVKISLGNDELASLNAHREAMGQPKLTRKEADELFPQVGTIDELHAVAVEDFYDIILRNVEENNYHLIVIDSIGNALSDAEQENESIHDKTYGGTSAPNTTFLKKLTNLLTMETDWGTVRDTCIIGINQVRDNIKDPNAPYKSPGGNALEHAKLVDIFMESGSSIGKEEKVMTPTGLKQMFIPTGKEVNWRIVKGKAGIHEGGKGRFAFGFEQGSFDYYADTFAAGVTHGIIEQAGAWLGVKWPGSEEWRIRTMGRDAFLAALEKDDQEKSAAGSYDSVINYIQEECFKKLGINVTYDSWDEYAAK